MKKILLILPNLPYPLNSGGNQGVYHMINAISKKYIVHIWYLSDFAVNQNLQNEFVKSLEFPCTIHCTIKKKGLNMATLRGISHKLNQFLLKKNKQYQHNEKIWGKETCSRYDDYILEELVFIINTEKIDIVQVEFFELIDYVYALPSTVKKIFVHHELSFARKKTLMENIDDTSVYDYFMYNRMLDREISALNRYDLVIALTEIDKMKLIRNGVITKIEVSPLFIPLKNESFPDFKFSNNRLTLVASGMHYPNIEGLKWFINKVHPHLQNLQQYSLEIIGSGWDHNQFGIIPSNIIFKGFVKDLATVVPGSVMIVPILSGSGMRMKILESVNNSVAFVTTTVGVEGLSFINEMDCFIEDNPEKFAERTHQLLSDNHLQLKFVMACRDKYKRMYSPKILASKRIEVLKKIEANE